MYLTYRGSADMLCYFKGFVDLSKFTPLVDYITLFLKINVQKRHFYEP